MSGWQDETKKERQTEVYFRVNPEMLVSPSCGSRLASALVCCCFASSFFSFSHSHHLPLTVKELEVFCVLFDSGT